MNKLDNLNEVVEDILKKDPECRNSDKKLIWRVWIKEGIGQFINEEIFMKVTNPESIRRIRQVIQNQEHKFVPTDWIVAKERGMLEHQWREWLGYCDLLTYAK